MPVKNIKKIEPEHRMSDLPMFLSKIQDALDTQIIALKNKTILVIRELDIALMLAVQNKVIYITDDAKCAEIFRKNTNAGMGNDDIVILINKWINKLEFKAVFEKMEKKIGKKKFDCAILNPPYGNDTIGDRYIHLNITQFVTSISEKTISIMPHRVVYSTSDKYNTYKEKFTTLKEVEEIDSSIFDDTHMANVGIFTFDDNYSGKISIKCKDFEGEVNSLFDLTNIKADEKYIFDALEQYAEFNNKIDNRNKTQLERLPANVVCFPVSRANGAMNARWFSKKFDSIEMQTKTEAIEYNSIINPGAKWIFYFSSIEEAKNCRDAMHRSLLRYTLYKLQDDQNMTGRVYKYFPNIDWHDVLTDADILIKCGLSEENAKIAEQLIDKRMQEIDETL